MKSVIFIEKVAKITTQYLAWGYGYRYKKTFS